MALPHSIGIGRTAVFSNLNRMRDSNPLVRSKIRNRQTKLG